LPPVCGGRNTAKGRSELHAAYRHDNALGQRHQRSIRREPPARATTFTGKNAWLNEVRPWEWLEMVACLLAFSAWLAAVLALGADRPLAGILLGFVPGVLLVHVAS